MTSGVYLQQAMNAARNREASTFPASTTQRFLKLFDPGGDQGPFGAHYHNVKGWVVDELLDTDRLQEAFQTVVSANESLRTSLRSDSDGSLKQVVHSATAAPVRVTRSVGDSRPLHQIADEFVASVEASSLPSDNLPAIRMECLVLDGHTIIVLIAHHVATDGLSVRSLFEQLKNAYEGDPKPSALQYSDVPDSQISPDDPRLDYWQNHLEGAVMTGLATDGQAATDYKRTSELRFSLPAEPVIRYGAAHKCSAFMVLFAGYMQLLRDACSATDLCVPAITVGRPAEAYEVVGAFFNFVPLRVRVSQDDDFEEILTEVRQVILEAHMNEVPFEAVLSRCPTLMDAFGDPSSAVGGIQALDNPYGATGEFAGARYEQVRDRARFQHVTSDIPNGFLLSFEVDPAGDIRGNVRYNPDEFQRTTIQQFADTYLEILRHQCRLTTGD